MLVDPARERSAQGKIGARLIPSLIDIYAVEAPPRVWASVPVDDHDISRGYKDITYKQFANAVNHAALWLKDHVPLRAGEPHCTFAYAGSKDLRYPILAVAAAKVRMRVLLCSPFATTTAQAHLLREAKCSVYLHDQSVASVAERVLANASGSVAVAKAVPELQDWLHSGVDAHFPYDYAWEDVNADQWLLFHTSGTTGMPKLVPYSHYTFSQFDAADLMTDMEPGEETMSDLFRDRRFYVALPHLHLVGMMAALQWTVFLNMVLVMGPNTPATGSQVLAVLQNANVQGAVIPPLLIQAVSDQTGGVDALRKLYALYFAGAPIARHVAVQLNGHCKLVPAAGSTETGAAFISVRSGEQDQWEYYRWRDSNGVRFDRKSEQLFELVFYRRPDLERFQQIFRVYPHLNEYRSGDLWTQHPTRADLWKYAGRTDDMVIFSHGEDLHATGMEQVIQEHPKIRAALIGGDGRSRPFLLLDLLPGERDHGEQHQTRLLDEIWPFVEKANEKCSDYVKLTRDLVLFTQAGRPLPLTAKETVVRRKALELYQAEIRQLYGD